jgi:hypothetical protein
MTGITVQWYSWPGTYAAVMVGWVFKWVPVQTRWVVSVYAIFRKFQNSLMVAGAWPPYNAAFRIMPN